MRLEIVEGDVLEHGHAILRHGRSIMRFTLAIQERDDTYVIRKTIDGLGRTGQRGLFCIPVMLARTKSGKVDLPRVCVV